jgi:hypothetical protein
MWDNLWSFVGDLWVVSFLQLHRKSCDQTCYVSRAFFISSRSTYLMGQITFLMSVMASKGGHVLGLGLGKEMGFLQPIAWPDMHFFFGICHGVGSK